MDSDGNIPLAKTRLALDWERERELERRKTLPKEEVAMLDKSDDSLSKRMSVN